MDYPRLVGPVHVKRPAHQVSLSVSIAVEIVDISLSGVLLASTLELRIGDRVQLNTAIGSRVLRAEIEIRRVSINRESPKGSARYRAGAIWLSHSAAHHAALAQILKTR